MRLLVSLLILILLLPKVSFSFPNIEFMEQNLKDTDVQTMIVEMEEDPANYQKLLKQNYPFIEVIATYKMVFKGIAVRGKVRDLKKLQVETFVSAIHPVMDYQLPTNHLSREQQQAYTVPSSINTTDYTGKGIKVAVVDTGIDYSHPDLQKNYQGGYDVVDFDDDPMESTIKDGIPTLHGTHVAGIIAANGKLVGVAKDAEIYAYRALGPGGSGTTIQVMAAIEQAVVDGVDIINLSLGNSINGPDFPTSKAVEKAIELGIIVVIANGNSGPDLWTVGSPATAMNAVSVGASAAAENKTFLTFSAENKKINLQVITPFTFEKYKTLQIATDKPTNGDLLLVDLANDSFEEIHSIKTLLSGLILYHDGMNIPIEKINELKQLNLPLAFIDIADALWVKENLPEHNRFLTIQTEYVDKTIAPFSSRGPVSVDWQIKPDLIAPGKDIMSTVPAGYEILSGTSMATPVVSGVIALLKEARPNWSNEQIIAALKTSAIPLNEEEERLNPVDQGMGEVNVAKALRTTTIIMNPLLAFGKYRADEKVKQIEVEIENLANKKQDYYFNLPKKEGGIRWTLPMKTTLNPKEKRTFIIELEVDTRVTPTGLKQGYLTLVSNEDTFSLPYLFISNGTDNPVLLAYEFELKPLTEDTYQYQFYLAEDVKEVSMYLFDSASLQYLEQLTEVINPETGWNKGEIVGLSKFKSGLYKIILQIRLQTDELIEEEFEFFIP